MNVKIHSRNAKRALHMSIIPQAYAARQSTTRQKYRWRLRTGKKEEESKAQKASTCSTSMAASRRRLCRLAWKRRSFSIKSSICMPATAASNTNSNGQAPVESS